MYGYLIILYVGIAFLAYGVYVLLNHSSAKSWPTVEGKLTALSYVEEFETGEYRVIYLAPKPKYDYVVNGVSYQGNTFCLDTKSGWIEERKVSKTSNFFCNVGDSLEVRYNPKNPAKSILQVLLSPKRKSHYLAICVSGILLMAVSIGLAIYIK